MQMWKSLSLQQPNLSALTFTMEAQPGQGSTLWQTQSPKSHPKTAALPEERARSTCRTREKKGCDGMDALDGCSLYWGAPSRMAGGGRVASGLCQLLLLPCCSSSKLLLNPWPGLCSSILPTHPHLRHKLPTPATPSTSFLWSLFSCWPGFNWFLGSAPMMDVI